MSITWNSTTIPNPTAYPIRYTQIGAVTVVASGAQVFDFKAAKKSISLKWENITTAEKDSIVTLATSFASTSLVLTNAGGPTLNVIPQPDLQIDAVGLAPFWNVTVTVREA